MDQGHYPCSQDKAGHHDYRPGPLAAPQQIQATDGSESDAEPHEGPVNEADIRKEVHVAYRQVPTPMTGPASSQDDSPA